MTLDPFKVAEMILAGYILAVALQALLGLGYTRLGRRTLMDREDRWKPLYFVLTAVSWVVSLAIATNVALPIAVESWNHKLATEGAEMLVALVLLMILITGWKGSRQQSWIITLLFALCALGGTWAGYMHFTAS